MSYRLDDQGAFDPRRVEAGNEACGACDRAGQWCVKELTDGVFSRAIALAIASQKVWDKAVKAGLVEAVGNGQMRIVDFFPLNHTKEQVLAYRKSNADRQQRTRDRKAVRHAVTNAVGECVTDGVGIGYGFSGSGSDPEGSAEGNQPESGVFKSDRPPPPAAPAASHTVSAIVREIRRFPIFEKLDAEAIALSHELWMPTKRPVQRLQWVLESISTCEAKVTGLGLRPEALQSRLVGFMRNATAPREQETPEGKTRKAAEADRHDGAMPSLSAVVKRASKAPEAPPVSKERMAALSAMVAGIGKAGAA